MVIFENCIISSGLPSSLEYFHRLAVCPYSHLEMEKVQCRPQSCSYGQ